ncbi:RNA polymerase sigma-70 factor [Phocaeicola sp.]
MKEEGSIFISELTEVFKSRQQQFIQFAYSYVRDRAEAEDIVMSAFTSVWEHRDGLQEHTNIPALLLTAIKNRSLNYLQHLEVRTNAEQQISDMRQKEIALRISTLEACDPDKLFCDEIQSLVHKAIAELPGTSRQVFMLSRMKNLSNKEIAAQMNLSVKTVEFHITRSLKQLRNTLKDYQFLWIWL